ncbi:hypothetical protein A2971_04855 [Candidatus Gottesmanbacteria bacterium RIFCSPLOWO2_01_FULL_46_21]|nr:MAG: hypothetical protein A2971_04855 [Candidatus Gottesmanbacteria bacterium RIFCSPLOWO2_01_FULL_46_21]
MTYVQRKFYFPEDLYIALSLQAKQEGLRIVDKLRTYTERGLRQDTQAKKSTSGGLAQLVQLGKTLKWKGPKDLARKHTKYAAEAAEADLQRIYDQYR